MPYCCGITVLIESTPLIFGGISTGPTSRSLASHSYSFQWLVIWLYLALVLMRGLQAVTGFIAWQFILGWFSNVAFRCFLRVWSVPEMSFQVDLKVLMLIHPMDMLKGWLNCSFWWKNITIYVSKRTREGMFLECSNVFKQELCRMKKGRPRSPEHCLNCALISAVSSAKKVAALCITYKDITLLQVQLSFSVLDHFCFFCCFYVRAA